MMRTSRLMLLGAAIAAIASFSACSGGKAGGDDDDDDTIVPTHCQILWSNIGTAADRYDLYVIDMPIDEWVTGEKNYTLDVSNEVVALFYDEYDFVDGLYSARAITTAGTFNVTVASTSAGQPVTLTDAGSQQFFDIDGNEEVGMLVGSGGIASFDGNWSDLDPDVAPDPGTGSVVLTYQGNSLTIGQTTGTGTAYVNYAVCYDSDSFAPMTSWKRAEVQFRRRLHAQ